MTSSFILFFILIISVKSEYLLLYSAYILKALTSLNDDVNMLNIFLCEEKTTATLLKQLEDQYYYIQIIKVDEKFHSPVSPNKIVFIVDLTCAPEAISWGASHNLFANPFKWILLYNEKSSLNILEHFENISLLVDSDVTLAGLGVNDTISLKKIFKHRSYMDIIEENVGVLNSNEQLILEPSFEVNRFRRRQDLKGIVLNSCIVITNNNSLNHLTDKRDKHIDSIAKVNYVLVQHLADFVNARLEYTVESTWGYKNNQSIWSGMIGELTRNKADIGGTALFITEDRVSTIDYIAMTTKTRSKFVFREPKLSYVTNVFVLPFDRDVWLASAALVVITGFVLFLVVKWEWYERKNGNLKEDEPYMELRESITDVAVLTFGALCQQGTTAIPYSMPGRITLIFLLISLMFLYTSYSANIVALLQSSSKSIQTLEDLLKSRLEVGIDDTVFNHFYFPNATEPIRKAIYEKKVAPPGQVPRYFPLLDGVKRMRQGLFAFHMETGPGYKIVGEIFEEGEKCGLQEIQFLQVPDPWLAIQKNSSFKESLKIGEVGLQIREIDAIYTKKPVCANRGNSFVSVGMVDCYAPTAILAGGVIFSLCVFLLEHYIHKRSKWYKRKMETMKFEKIRTEFYKHHFGIGSQKNEGRIVRK